MLYRGIRKSEFKETNNGSWDTLISTFLSLDVAKRYASENGIIYEVKLNKDSPHPHASISNYSKFSFE